MRVNSKLKHLEQDATNAESTVSLIIGASAADPSTGERHVDGRTAASRTRTVLRDCRVRAVKTT
jgi:hypothetical protein